jgi:hypothetical protein
MHVLPRPGLGGFRHAACKAIFRSLRLNSGGIKWRD